MKVSINLLDLSGCDHQDTNNLLNAKDSGGIMPLAIISMLGMLGVCGLAIDLGNVFLVRNELQKAADSAALLGATSLSRTSPPNFQLAQANATTSVPSSKNMAGGHDLTASTVSTGGWDISGIQTGLRPYSSGLAPAVQVKIQKNSSQNGPLVTWFSGLLGITSVNLQATAVAIGDIGPSTTNINQLMPLAISQCLYDNFWNSATQSPSIARSTTPICSGCSDQTIGKPYTFRVAGSYGSGNNSSYTGNTAGSCPSTGQWTSFFTVVNSGSYLQSLFTGQIQDSEISVSNSIYIMNGAKANTYDTINGLINGTAFAGLVPVVSGTVIPGSNMNVTAFACVKVTFAQKTTSNKFVEIQLLPVSSSTVPNVNPPNFSCQLQGTGVVTNPYVLRPPLLTNYYGNDW
jgi:Flp pilus assembly protein TadG